MVHSPQSARRLRVPARRGIAMMLVLIALFTATVLTTAAITSRNNSGQIGDNIVRSVETSWAAESAAMYTATALESGVDLVDLTSDGSMDNLTVCGVDVDILLTDLDGQPPSGDESVLLMTATARKNGAVVVVQKIIRCVPEKPEKADDILNEDLEEFAAVVQNNIEVSDSATLGVWANSPARTSSSRLRIAVTSVSGGDVDIGSQKRPAVEFYADETAAIGAQAFATDSRFGGGRVLPMQLPLTVRGVPSALSALGDEGDDVDVEEGNSLKLSTAGAYGDVTVEEGSKLLIDGSAGRYWSVDDLTVEENSVLYVSGQVDLLVRGKALIKDGGLLSLAGRDDRLTIHLLNDLEVSDGCIGTTAEMAQNPARHPKHFRAYINPNRIRILGVAVDPESPKSAHINLKYQSVVVATINVPHAHVHVDDASAIIGRISSHCLRLKDGTHLIYDPALDSRMGLASEDSPLYAEDGQLADGVGLALDAAATSLPEDTPLYDFVKQWLVDNGYDDPLADLASVIDDALIESSKDRLVRVQQIERSIRDYFPTVTVTALSSEEDLDFADPETLDLLGILSGTTESLLNKDGREGK